MSTLSEILVKLRKDRGWSQGKLSAISGVSERTIQRLENNGSCSLETKMALASAFEISPAELSEVEQNQKTTVEMKMDWSGAIGLFVLGLACPLIVLLTATNGIWEVSSFCVVIGLTIILSMMSHGAYETYRLFDNTSWLVKYPSFVSGLNDHIAHAKVVIENAYIIGLVASMVTGLALTVHGSQLIENIEEFITVVIKPLLYAVLFNEFWFRPYKRKMEKMLENQLNTES